MVAPGTRTFMCPPRHRAMWTTRTTSVISHLRLSSITGNVVMVTGGRNIGRVGTVTDRVNHIGTEDMIHIKDARGNVMATR